MEIKAHAHRIVTMIVSIFLVCFSLITYHPDLRAFVLAHKFIRQGEVFTFYDHVSKLPVGDQTKKIYGDDIFIYPPLAYLIPSAFYLPFSSFLGSFENQIIFQDSSIYQKNIFYLPFLIYKLPFIVFGLLTFWIISKFFDSKKDSRLATVFWLTSPLLFVVVAMGQVDTILTFFLALSVYYLKKSDYSKSALSIALSALVKPMGLALLPLFFVYLFRQKGLIYSVKKLIPAIATWVIITGDYIFSPAFKMYALLGNLSSKTLYAGIQISGAVQIPWFFIVFAVVALLLYQNKIGLFKSLSLTVLASLCFNHFHPQWFLWFLPFLIYISVSTKKYHYFFLSTLSWLIILFSFDPSLHIGLILPLKASFPPTMTTFLNGSTITLLARAYLVALLGLLFFEKEDHETN